MNGVAAPRRTAETLTVAEVGEHPRAVSVVMVIYFPGEPMKRSLACVLADPAVSELVVVDNGSSAEEAAHLRALAVTDHRVVVVSGQGNVGFARASNLGARKAGGERLVFLNPDAFLQPGCIAELVQAIENRPVPSLVGARVLNADGTEQRGGRRGEITPLSAMLSLSTLAARIPALSRFEVHWESDTSPDHMIEVPTISGACFCMRREDFEAVGGFDEGYFLHVEDVDLCWRVRGQGGVVLFHPGAEVIHLGGTSQTSPMKVEFHKGVGLARFFRRRADGVGQHLTAWLLWPVIVGAALLRPLIWQLRRG
ncbi:glycosyltransferase [Phenylobacterium sp.]|jgi:N-acetylglucosaminyl-diphospho-decaprenol L-rhamnosyltransferase|uniref:glycosyltransferase n=1 Tax=Phenylobacterium sp. TaxID=1871053 RepID=UPI0037C82F53